MYLEQVIASIRNVPDFPKPGILPAETIRMEYALEYGVDALEMHKDSIVETDVVLLHDDLLAMIHFLI